jgi:DNA helicase-2/ATP-dependent DNA helicase PcrA
VLATAKPGEFILSRLNAPLVGLAMAFLKAGTPAKVQGKDIGDGLLNLVQALARGAAATSMPKFLERLSIYRETQRARIIASKDLEKLDALEDKVDVLKMLAKDCPGVPTLEARIEDLFTDEPGASIVLSTVHKAKGLEADRVYLLEDTFALSGFGGRDTKRAAEERNIRYVAMTRSKRELTWCEGSYR